MLTFQPIDEYLDLEGITLPIRGKTYLIAPPDALTGLEVTRLMAAALAASNGLAVSYQQIEEIVDINEQGGGELERRVLGEALNDMIADAVPWPMVKLAFQTAMMWISQGAETAARFWASGGGETGKAPEPTTTPRARPASRGSKKRRK